MRHSTHRSLGNSGVVSLPNHGLGVIFKACRLSWLLLSVSAELLILPLEILTQPVQLRFEGSFRVKLGRLLHVIFSRSFVDLWEVLRWNHWWLRLVVSFLSRGSFRWGFVQEILQRVQVRLGLLSWGLGSGLASLPLRVVNWWGLLRLRHKRIVRPSAIVVVNDSSSSVASSRIRSVSTHWLKFSVWRFVLLLSWLVRATNSINWLLLSPSPIARL